MRQNGLEELILTVSVDGKRSRGRQKKYLTHLSRWLTEQLPRREEDNVKEINLLRTAKDRSSWKYMTAHTLNGHCT